MTNENSDHPRFSITDTGDLEIQLSKKSSRPPDPIAARIKASGTLIVAITGLIASVFTYFKPVDHSVNKASYEILARDLKEVSQQTADNHDAILAMRGYIEGTLNRTITPPISPRISSSARIKTSSKLAVVPEPAPVESSPPNLGPTPQIIDPPTFDNVLKGAR
jgi:hypothetical protein